MSLVALLASPLFRTVITGAGFFGDSYDLFVTDGVTAILKNLGPVTRVRYPYISGNGTSLTLDSYFSAYCTSGVRCLPRVYDNGTSTWVPNPGSVWTPEMTPRYQQQTTDLKNGVSNAALIGSILGQLAFGVGGDWVGRKWCFVLTSSLIILGCLGSAASSAGAVVAGRLNAAGAWGDTSPTPPSFASDVYLQLSLWRFVLGFGVGGEYPLAGAIASEGATSTQARGKSVLFTFSMQGWGKLTAALVNYGLVGQLGYFGGPWALDDAWRFALAFGCVLNVLTLPFRYWMEESEIFKEKKSTGSASASSSSSSSGKGGEEEGEAFTTAEKRARMEGGPSSGSSSSSSGGESTLTLNPLKGGGGSHHHLHHTTSPGALEWGGIAVHPPSSSSSGSMAVQKPSPAAATHSSSSSPPSFWASLRVTLTLLYVHRWTLVGTAGTWFLIDVTFYGQSLMNTAVVSEAVSSTGGLNAMERLRSSLLSTVWIMLIAIPGYFIAIALVDRLGRRRLQTGGFVATAAVFFALGGGYDSPLRTGGGGGRVRTPLWPHLPLLQCWPQLRHFPPPR